MVSLGAGLFMLPPFFSHLSRIITGKRAILSEHGVHASSFFLWFCCLADGILAGRCREMGASGAR